jgi:probable HAF family extracellular repeat protein
MLSTTRPLEAQQKYTVKELTLPGGIASYANGINDAGQVVGSSYVRRDDAAVPRPFLYDGSIHDLGTLGGSSGSAWAINNAGRIVGSSSTAGTSQEYAFLYDGLMHNLGTLPGGIHSRALGINNEDIVVGESYDAQNGKHAFLFDGSMHALGALPGDTYSTASGINSRGRIVGGSSDFFSHAFLYEETFHDLGTLPGLNDSFASAINERGQVAGYSWLESGGTDPTPFRAWFYDGSLHDLGAPGVQSVAYAINNSGVVVGGSYISSEIGWHAFIYRGGQTYELNDYLDSSGEGWTLWWGSGINASGQIAGTGTHNGQLSGFLLTPVCALPTISGVSADPKSLWPPNHKFVNVTISYTVASVCTTTDTLSVDSNEPGSDQWLIVDAHHVELVSARDSNGTGRIYTITITSTNASGSSTATVTVTVPHDQGGQS